MDEYMQWWMDGSIFQSINQYFWVITHIYITFNQNTNTVRWHLRKILACTEKIRGKGVLILIMTKFYMEHGHNTLPSISTHCDYISAILYLLVTLNCASSLYVSTRNKKNFPKGAKLFVCLLLDVFITTQSCNIDFWTCWYSKCTTILNI